MKFLLSYDTHKKQKKDNLDEHKRDIVLVLLSYDKMICSVNQLDFGLDTMTLSSRKICF